MKNSLAESPSGLVHLISISSNSPLVFTACGQEVNKDTWSRIRILDGEIQGKSPSSIKKMIELPTCERCFS